MIVQKGNTLKKVENLQSHLTQKLSKVSILVDRNQKSRTPRPAFSTFTSFSNLFGACRSFPRSRQTFVTIVSPFSVCFCCLEQFVCHGGELLFERRIAHFAE